MRGGEPINFAVDFEKRKMYLKFVRHSQPSGSYCRGILYSVHFRPNEKGGYSEQLTIISDVYERGNAPALIYPAGARQVNGRLRVSFGSGKRHALLDLIDRAARDSFFAELRSAILQREDVRIEVANN